MYAVTPLIWDHFPGPLQFALSVILLFFAGFSLYSSVESGLHSARRRKKLFCPPKAAEFLFYLFLSADDCDALVGDLEERHRLIRKRFGKGHADFWYWSMALRSVVPITGAWTKKITFKPLLGIAAWAVAKGLIGHDSWLAALVELYRKIRS